jgi:hypothetical protein
VSILGPPPTPPDLTVTNLEFIPATPAPGSSFQVRITINNSGTASAPDFVIRALRQSPGANCLLDPGIVMFDRHSSIGGSASIVFTENATIAGAGNFRICARLDHTNLVAESNENNNLLQRDLTVAVPGQPDLYVQNVGMTDWTPNVGHTVDATVNVRNGGSASTGSTFYVRLLRQETGATCPGPGLVLFDQSTGPLAAGAATGVTRTITWPSPTGTFRLCAVLDHTALVSESNEGNNTLQSGNFTVSP